MNENTASRAPASLPGPIEPAQSILFTPFRLGALALKNRFVSSATVECLAGADNRLTPEYLKIYSRLAKGGVGLIIPGNYFVSREGRAVDMQLVLDRDETVHELRGLTEAVHAHGAKIVAQLNHGGRQCSPDLIGARPVSASRVRDGLTGVRPRPLTPVEIERVIRAFADAARRVKDAGFDGVQINAAHGYLINQFLSARTNRRNDEWGGPPARRSRFLIRVYERIREAVGVGFPVLVKVNAEDGIARGVTLPESIEVCRRLEALGVDAIEVSGGIKEAGFVTTKGDVPGDLIREDLGLFKRLLFKVVEGRLRRASRFTEGYFLPHAAAIKQSVRIPVIAVGGLRQKATMERLLERGDADLVALSRPFIRQPNLVSRMERDPRVTSATCVSCNRCTVEVTLRYRPLRCYFGYIKADGEQVHGNHQFPVAREPGNPELASDR